MEKVIDDEFVGHQKIYKLLRISIITCTKQCECVQPNISVLRRILINSHWLGWQNLECLKFSRILFITFPTIAFLF